MDKNNDQQIWIGKGSKIDKDCFIKGPVVIGKNVEIKKGVSIDSFSVIGDGTLLDKDCSIKRSLIWKNSYIGRKVQLRGSIICDKVQLLDGASIFEHSVIGNGTVIKDNSIIKPNIKIWPNKTIDSGTEVNTNLVWGSKCTKSLFGARGIRGEVNIDITPEFTSKLGASYGATYDKSSKIGVSYDGSISSYMLNSSLISGLLSSGVKVYNFNKLLLPMNRTAIKFYGLDGGVHIASSTEKDGQIVIDFLDKNGSNISRNLERNIENIFIREDFARCGASDIKTISTINDFSSFYIQNVLNRVKSQKVDLKILVNSESDYVREILVNTAQELGCKLEYANLNIMSSRIPSINAYSNELSYFTNYVRLSNADLGVSIDSTCENILLIDEKGRIINEDLYLALVTLILFKKHKGSTAVIPISASNVMETLASKYNGKVIRTKTSIQDIMSELNSSNIQQVTDEQFAFHFDAIESLIKIIDFLNINKLKLSELVDMIPNFYVSKKIVECPWDIKGKVMRTLIEDKEGEKVELFEGVKVYRDGGWVLVLPDAEKPVCRVIGEGMTTEVAEELTDVYVKKIKKIELGGEID